MLIPRCGGEPTVKSGQGGVTWDWRITLVVPEPRASSFPEKVRIVGRDLDKLLLAEKEKKLSVAAYR